MMGMSDYDLTDALELPRHGGPEDRGSADAYYGRDPQPHYFEGDTLQSVKRTDLSCQEYLEYYQGYNNCTDRKDWG